MKKKIFVVLLIVAILVTSLCVALPAYAEEKAPVVGIACANLSLDDNIFIYFRAYYDNIDTASDAYGMIIWKSEQTEGNYTYANADGNADAVVYTGSASWKYLDAVEKDVATYSYGIAAKEMADVVYAQAWACKSGTYYYSDVVPYSATIYAARKLGLVNGVAGTADENLKALLRGMLNYGALAQTYFGYNTENLATNILQTHTVTFKDWNGNDLSTVTVNHGQAATAPANPTRDGFTFKGWDKAFDNITEDTTVTATYEAESKLPTITVKSVEASAGDTVDVTVSIKNNPGILGAIISISYDNSALTLTNAVNKVSNVGYQPPAQYLNPTSFIWYSQDLTWTGDGVILTLTFSISDTSSKGDYAITLEYDPNDVFDGDGDPIDFEVINATIEVQ